MMNKSETYIGKEDVAHVVEKLKRFENDLSSLFDAHSLDLRVNTGRRNMLLSQAQEAFFSAAISEKGFDCTHDGRTGEADIVIKDLDKELECKLTSGSGSSWPLQCDYATLARKGALDFLYMLCNKDFDQFAVLLFENLTIDDFFFPAPGSRQKSRMNKVSAMKKCTVLMGTVENKNTSYSERYTAELNNHLEKSWKRINELEERIERSRTKHQRDKAQKILLGEKDRIGKRESRIKEKINYWKNSNTQFSINLESL